MSYTNNSAKTQIIRTIAIVVVCLFTLTTVAWSCPSENSCLATIRDAERREPFSKASNNTKPVISDEATADAAGGDKYAVNFKLSRRMLIRVTILTIVGAIISYLAVWFDWLLNTQSYKPSPLRISSASESPRINITHEEIEEFRQLVDQDFLDEQIEFLDNQVVEEGAKRGLLRGYNFPKQAEDSPLYDKQKYLVEPGRAWPYDTAVGIHADLANGRAEEAGTKVEALVRVMQAEDEQGFGDVIHFSYNTRGSNYVQNLAPLGATTWVLKACLAYSARTGDSRFVSYLEEKIKFVLSQQVIEVNGNEADDIRYGLFKSNLKGMFSEVIVTEHNIDVHDLLNMAYQLTGNDAYKERKDILLNALLTRLWDKRGFFYMCLDPYQPHLGKVTARTAIDCSTWAGSMLLSNGYIKEARQAIDYIERNFVVRHEFQGSTAKLAKLPAKPQAQVYKGIIGTRFYKGTSSVLKFFGLDYDAPENLFVQTEATATYLHFLYQYAQVAPDSKERRWALNRIRFYLDSLKRLRQHSSTGGLPYATKDVGEDFSIMDSSVASATLVTFLGELKNPHLSWTFIGIPEKPFSPTLSPLPIAASREIARLKKQIAKLQELHKEAPSGRSAELRFARMDFEKHFIEFVRNTESRPEQIADSFELEGVRRDIFLQFGVFIVWVWEQESLKKSFLDETQQILKGLPPTHVDSVRLIFAQLFHSEAERDFCVVCKIKDVRGTLQHEIGHGVFYMMPDQDIDYFVKLSHASNTYITPYASTNVREDFAEMYTSYTKDTLSIDRYCQSDRSDNVRRKTLILAQQFVLQKEERNYLRVYINGNVIDVPVRLTGNRITWSELERIFKQIRTRYPLEADQAEPVATPSNNQQESDRNM